MSSGQSLVELQRPIDGLCLLLTGAETDLGKVLLATLLDEGWPLAHIHLLYRKTRGGPGAAERFARFCARSPLMAGVRERRGAAPDLSDKVTVHEGAPAGETLGLAAETLASLVGSVGAVIVAARSKRPDSDPSVALDRDLHHPLLVQRLFPDAALLLVSDVDAVSDAGHEADAVVDERGGSRCFDPRVEVMRLTHLATHGPRIAEDEDDRALIRDRRASAFARARSLGFPSTGGYARAIAEALWLERASEGATAARHAILRIGRSAPVATGQARGWCRDPNLFGALTDLLRLPLRHLPVDPGARLYASPLDRSARQCLLALSALLTGRAPRLMQAVPSAADDITSARAITLGELVLRRYPSPAGADAWVRWARRWLVSVPDPARSAEDVATLRRITARLRGSVAGIEGTGTTARARELLNLGAEWLDASSAQLDARLKGAEAVADRWIPGRKLAFDGSRFAGLLTAQSFEAGTPWADLARPVDWRQYWVDAVGPAMAHHLALEAPLQAAGPSPRAAAAGFKTLALSLLGRIGRP